MATRMQVLAPIGTFVVVVAVGATYALVSGSGGSHAPRPLRLSTGVTRDAATASGTTSGGGDYRLTGTLPAGTPPDAPAWQLQAAASDDATAARVAKALHAPQLSRSGQSWSWSPCGPETAVSSDGAVSGCAISTPGSVTGSSGGSSGSGTAVAPPLPSPGQQPTPVEVSPAPTTPVPDSTVTTAATPVFEALGLDIGKATIDTSPYGGSATLAPTVDVLQTVGEETRVSVGADGTVQSANGWLGEVVKGDSYPLITAQQAFDALPIAPRMMLACPVGPDGKGCVQPPPQEVTGAHLGLLLQPTTDSHEVLVPAWLFDVKGSTQPLAQIAVEAKYLGSPEPPATPFPQHSGAVETPMTVPPASTDPSGPRAPVSIDAAYRGATATEVVVQYGDSSSCPHVNVTHDVKEDAGTVYVVLTSDPLGKQVCTSDYRPMRVTVELRAPLGDRKVVDANGGKQVPLS